MSKTILVVLCLIASMGAGCVNKQQKTTSLKTPTLNLISPGLFSTTTESTISVIGQTDALQVYVGSNSYEVFRRRFKVDLDLKDGKNEFPFSVGNGLVTSTMLVVVEKIPEQIMKQ